MKGIFKIFIAIFLLLAIAIKNSENFQLRDHSDGVSDEKSVSGKKTTKVRFPFRKLEIPADDNDGDDDDEDENDQDDDNEDDEEDDSSGEVATKYTFAKVRKPTFEIKKRGKLKQSKLAKFRDPSDDIDDDDDDDGESKVSFFSKVLNFFKRNPKETSDNEDESKEKVEESAEVDDKDDDDDDEEKKPFLSEIFDKFKDFLEARNQQKKIVDDNDDDDQDDDSSGEEASGEEASGESKDEDEASGFEEIEKPEIKASDKKLKISLKETFTNVFNRKPFNLIFDFDSAEEEDEVRVFEDSEEDEINYQRLLREEKLHEQEHTEQLIKQTSEEETPPTKAELAPVIETTVKSEVKSKPSAPLKKKSKEEAHLAKKEFEKLLLSLPSFVPDYSKVKNPECQKQGEVFQRQLRGQRIWALEMMDANAKIPSGLMRGNTNQLGDFDLCMKISQKIKISETNSMKMKGKYCLANIDVIAAADQLKLPVHLIQGRNFIRSTINDVSCR